MPARSRRATPVRKTYGEGSAERQISSIVNQSWDIMDTGLMNERVRQMIEARSAAGVEAALPWEQFIQSLGQTVKPMEAQVGRSIGEALKDLGPVKGALGFSSVDALSVKYAQEQSGQLIRNITDSQRTTIRGILGRALNGEYTTDQAARQIRQGIGLHPAWAQAVRNYEARMTAQPAPKGMSANKWMDTIDARTTRYRDRLIRRRSLTIARTEVQTAQNLGRYATWADSIGQGINSPASRKEWSPGPGACPICQDLEGQIVPWDGAFSNGAMMPPAHPNCRCTANLLPPEYINPALNPRDINWTDGAQDLSAPERDYSAGQALLDTAGDAADAAMADEEGGDGGDEEGGAEDAAAAEEADAAATEDDTAAEEPQMTAYERDLQAMQAQAVATKADSLTYETTLHWSEDKLFEAITKYAEDPEAVDKILGIIDQREAAAAAKDTARAQLEQYARAQIKPITEDTNPLTNPAVRPARQLTADQRVEEEYSQYVGNQLNMALEHTNGVLFNKANLATAREKGIDEYALFTGQYKTASKYASDELQAFWREYGRETLGSFRYRALGRASDRWYADIVRNNGLMRGAASSDRSQF